MTTAIVLGNGNSRQALDLDRCRAKAKIYGCNALYRDFTPDVLVATDRPIATAIQDLGYSLQQVFYTRSPQAQKGARTIPTVWRGWSSGPIAAAIAAQDGAGRIYLVGFDLGGINGRLNNLYADTEFYKSAKDRATYAGNWIQQLIKVFRQFPDTQFVRIEGEITTPVPDFARCDNYSTQPLAWFTGQINTGGEI